MDSAPKAKRRPSLIGRALHRIAVFLVAMCIGVAGTLAWQSPASDLAKQRAANWAQQQGWTTASRILASKTDRAVEQPSPPAQGTAPQTLPRAAGAMPIASSGSSHDVQQFEAMARDLVAVRQSVEQLATEQRQLAPDQRQMAADQKQLAARQEQMAADLKQLTTRQAEMAADQKQLTTRQGEMAANQKQLTAGQEQMAADLKHEFAADQERAAREIFKLQTAVESIQRRRPAHPRHGTRG